MIDSPIVLVTQAVVDAINGGTYSQPITASRVYSILNELHDPKILKVLVTSKAAEHSVASRSAVQIDIKVDIAIYKKVGLSVAELDAMMGLVEEVSLELRKPQLFSNFSWVSTENAPIYSPDFLDQAKEFLSILTLTFRALVER